VHRAQEAVEVKFRSLPDVSAEGMRWLVVSKKEHEEQFKELSLLPNETFWVEVMDKLVAKF
jgi:hypothetical protein